MTETTANLSLGQQLKNAREALGLSIKEVAQKTNLKKNHIDAFENDIFILQNVPPAFARGYVRNYVRFLRLPENLIDSVNYGEVTIPKEVKRAAPIKVAANPRSQSRWVRNITWLILLAAVGMTLAWWWQEHQKDQASRDALVSNTEIPAVQVQDNSQSVSPDTVVAAENQTVAPTSNNSESEANSQPSANEIVLNNTTPAHEATQTEPAANATEAPQAAESATAESTSSEPINVLQQQPEQAEQTVANSEQPEVAVINDELRIEIVGGQSWITVRGAKNKRLVEKLYNAGEVLTFNHNEQYRLTIGAPANVKIYYKGQQVPLKVDGRVARFKLPLAN